MLQRIITSASMFLMSEFINELCLYTFHICADKCADDENMMYDPFLFRQKEKYLKIFILYLKITFSFIGLHLALLI